MDVFRLTLRQLQIFVAVAHAGSTSAAAEAVALSQSATSSALIDLERQLGVSLFDRVGKRLGLSESGRVLLPMARSLLDGARQIAQAAQDPDQVLQSLRIGASMTIADHLLVDVLCELLGRRPQQSDTWRSRVDVGNTQSICSRVAAFELDLGLIEGDCHEASLRVEPWLSDEMVIVGPAGMAAATRLSVSALRQAVWLLREPGSGTRDACDRALLPHLKTYRRALELGSNDLIKKAVGAGMGLACLSRWVVKDALATGHLQEMPTVLPRIERRYHWVIHREKQVSPPLQRLIDLLQSSVQNSVPA
ncbi:MAG TPA: LysR substrate-binding domain-containing protein [Aquabacterium sp.]|nr:LysR substrate-binding domain-containing protein [Aquabacterium sp.]